MHIFILFYHKSFLLCACICASGSGSGGGCICVCVCLYVQKSAFVNKCSMFMLEMKSDFTQKNSCHLARHVFFSFLSLSLSTLIPILFHFLILNSDFGTSLPPIINECTNTTQMQAYTTTTTVMMTRKKLSVQNDNPKFLNISILYQMRQEMKKEEEEEERYTQRCRNGKWFFYLKVGKGDGKRCYIKM